MFRCIYLCFICMALPILVQPSEIKPPSNGGEHSQDKHVTSTGSTNDGGKRHTRALNWVPLTKEQLAEYAKANPPTKQNDPKRPLNWVPLTKEQLAAHAQSQKLNKISGNNHPSNSLPLTKEQLAAAQSKSGDNKNNKDAYFGYYDDEKDGGSYINIPIDR